MLQKLIIIYIIQYYSVVFAIYRGEVRLDDDDDNRIQRLSPGNQKKINAVLFFADTKPFEDYKNSSGLDCLKLDKKPELKHCVDYPESILKRARRRYRFKRHTCTCYKRLQDGILSLLNYAQNVLGMVTALGSISNHSFSNSIRFGNSEIQIQNNNENQIEKKETDQLKQTVQIISEMSDNDKRNKEMPILTNKEEQAIRHIPLLNVFPKDSPPPFYAFTDEEERKKRSEGPYVLSPEHREIFKIRTRRQMPFNNKPKEISDSSYLNKEQKMKTIFDIMDIMNTLQRSLFGTMLQDDTDMYAHDRETCPIQSALLRKIRQPGIFEVVQKTLYSVINASETGFLMVIIGGQLSDISNSYSPLVQSIKHVIENTEEDSTLIVLTGMCPNSPDCPEKLPCDELNKKSLPLFATGPGSDDFSSCFELYDIPLTVQRILTRYNCKKREALPQDLEVPLQPRAKRNIIDFIDDVEEIDDDEEYNEDFQYVPKRNVKTVFNKLTHKKNKTKSKSSATNNEQNILLLIAFINLLFFSITHII